MESVFDDTFLQILLKVPNDLKQFSSCTVQSVVEMAILFIAFSNIRNGQVLLQFVFRPFRVPSWHVTVLFSLEQLVSEQQ